MCDYCSKERLSNLASAESKTPEDPALSQANEDQNIKDTKEFMAQEREYAKRHNNAILDDLRVSVSLGVYGAIEQKLQVCLNDKPRLLPQFVWEYLLRLVISLRYLPLEVRRKDEI